jgi:hypothetical protein
MTLDEWFAAKLREFENDLEFQREKLLYLLGERIAVLGGIEMPPTPSVTRGRAIR